MFCLPIRKRRQTNRDSTDSKPSSQSQDHSDKTPKKKARKKSTNSRKNSKDSQHEDTSSVVPPENNPNSHVSNLNLKVENEADDSSHRVTERKIENNQLTIPTEGVHEPFSDVARGCVYNSPPQFGGRNCFSDVSPSTSSTHSQNLSPLEMKHPLEECCDFKDRSRKKRKKRSKSDSEHSHKKKKHKHKRSKNRQDEFKFHFSNSGGPQIAFHSLMHVEQVDGDLRVRIKSPPPAKLSTSPSWTVSAVETTSAVSEENFSTCPDAAPLPKAPPPGKHSLSKDESHSPEETQPSGLRTKRTLPPNRLKRQDSSRPLRSASRADSVTYDERSDSEPKSENEDEMLQDKTEVIFRKHF